MAGLVVSVAQAQTPIPLTVQADKPGVKVSPDLFGVFFEEINHAGDGGIYAELVRNRTFKEKDGDKPVAWSILPTADKATQASLTLDAAQPLNQANLQSLRFAVASVAKGERAALANTGFWGIGVKKGERYRLSLHARSEAAIPLTVTLEGVNGKVYARTELSAAANDWQQKTAVLTADASDPNARLVISTTKPGTIWLNVVSLFPDATYKNRPNGLRSDLAEKVAALQPAFLRFPGGCYVEGGDYLANRFQWKDTVTDIASRPGHLNDIWHYWSTDGLGYHEYLQMCEDMKSAPMFVVNCGLSHKELLPMDQLDTYLQDTLDAIEYANGPVSTKWGALRAKNGHPASYNLKYIEIGNENGLWQGFGGLKSDYTPRYKVFYDAIKAKYPEIRTISNTRVDAPMEIVDDHYYNSPGWFWQNIGIYDNTDRKGPKIYVGEYAVTIDSGQGSLRAALAEAAWMTGLERNGDVVVMASYAPLFVNTNDRAWNPDAIGFDSKGSYGTPSYYVQQLFAENRIETTIPATFPNPPQPVKATGGIGLGSWSTQAEFKDITVTGADGKKLYTSDFVKGTDKWVPKSGDWKVVDGAYRQSAGDTDRRVMLELPELAKATDYTVHLKARRLSGDEGFLVLFHAPSTDNYYWWNVGGWGNSLSVLEKSVGGVKTSFGPRVPIKLEDGRWYDVRITVEGSRIRCYLDDKLLTDVQDTTTPALAANAGRAADGSLIVKFVNGTDTAAPVSLDLAGLTNLSATGQATILTSGDLSDENSLQTPTRVIPTKQTLSGITSRLSYKFPARSLTILRLPSK